MNRPISSSWSESFAYSVVMASLFIMLAGYLGKDLALMHQGMGLGFAGIVAVTVLDAINRVSKYLGQSRWRRAVYLLAISVLCLLVLNTQAHAEGVTPANAPLKEWIDTGNTANNLLCSTIGDVGGTGLFGCSKTTALHQVLKVFNLLVFSVAALFVAWGVISGTITSANDGEFLGKRNSSTWGPLRMVIGAAMLIPAFNGFNLAQLIMVWATAVGVGAAGAAASGAITEMETFTNIYSAPPNLIKGNDVANLAKPKAKCVAEWVQSIKEITDFGTDIPDISELKWGSAIEETIVAGRGNVLTVKYGATTAVGGYYDNDCGEISFLLPDGAKASDGANGILDATAAAMRINIPMLSNVIVDEFVLAAKGGTVGDEAIKAARARIDSAIASFDTNMSLTTKAAALAANTFESKLSVGKGNWVALGFADVRAASAGVSVASGTGVRPASVPVRRPAPVSCTENSTGELYCTEGKLATDRISDAFSVFGNGLDAVATGMKAVTNVMGFGDRFNDDLNKKVGELGKTVAESMQDAAKGAAVVGDGSSNPLKSLINLGTSISSWMVCVIMWFVAASLALVAISYFVPGIGGVITVLGFILTALAIPIMMFGIKLAAYLPFLVAIVWSAALLNWLVIVIEALFGAPLWAMVHLDMEGEGLNFQRTGHGYIFLLNLLFRPVMMVGGLIFAKLAMAAIFGLFLGGVSDILSNLTNVSSDWWGNLMMIIGAIWVTVAFAEQIVTQSMSVIFVIPDKVLAWIGGQFGSDVGMGMEGATGGAAKGGMGSVGHGAAQAGDALAKGAGDAAKKLGKARANKGGGGGSVSGGAGPGGI
jgi:conjugal transfer/type IV secretion protein DotA/TraY